MAFEFDPDLIFKEGAVAVAKKLGVVKLYGIWGDGRCTCGNPEHRVGGGAEVQCGKHPQGKNWQNRAATTEEELAEWCDTTRPFNIGIILGPRSGVIDMEWDTDEGRAYAESMGLTDIETPTYISGRSEHRLFLWDERLSGCGAVVKPGGLEVRLGTGELGAQSVLPPSWHWSGVRYRWKPGFSLEDVAFAPLPEVLLRAIVNDVDSGRQLATSQFSSRHLLHTVVEKGARHPYLRSYITRKVFLHPLYLQESAQADMIVEVMAVNEKRCRPAKTEQEVLALFHSCVEYRRKMEERQELIPTTDAGLAEIAEKIDEAVVPPQAPVSGYALQGLKWAPVDGWPTGEWLPGDWSIRMVHSDPPEIVLCVPAWNDTPCKGQVAFAFGEFRSAKMVAAKVFEGTRRVLLDGDGKEWQTIWKGQEGNSKRPKLAGLVEKLLIKKQRADDVYVGTSSLRYATLASYLLEAFARAKQPKEDKPEPDKSGRPCWVRPGELWLGWVKTWEEIGRAHDVAAGERVRMKRLLCERLGVDDFREGRHTFGSAKLSYVIFTPDWIEAVEEFAAGGGVVEDCPPNTGISEKNCGKKNRANARIPRLATEVIDGQGVSVSG